MKKRQGKIPASRLPELEISLIEVESEFEVAAYADRRSIFDSGSEANLLSRLNRLFSQAVGKSPDNANVRDAAITREDYVENDSALDLVLASLFGIFRLLFVEDGRSESGRHRLNAAAAAETHIAAADVAAATGSNASAITAANAGACSSADARSGSRPA